MQAAKPARDHEACCAVPAAPCPCPVCGKLGRAVSPRTVENHVPEKLRAELGSRASFCLNPACDAVYCNPAGFVVRKGQTVRPVTLKDRGEDVPVCYCFGFSRSDIAKDMADRGRTDIPERIRLGIKEGRCDCERKNPQGACCLGNVAGEIEALSRAGQPPESGEAKERSK